jgi:hypothetical protein
MTVIAQFEKNGPRVPPPDFLRELLPATGIRSRRIIFHGMVLLLAGPTRKMIVTVAHNGGERCI